MKKIYLVNSFELIMLVLLVFSIGYKSINGMFSGLILMMIVTTVVTYYFPIYPLVKYYNKRGGHEKGLVLSLISYGCLSLSVGVAFLLLQGWISGGGVGVFYFSLMFNVFMLILNLKSSFKKDKKFIFLAGILVLLNLFLFIAK